MLTRTLRKSLKHQEGQALVLACLMMLILAIAVFATVNLGHTVTERIRLQNTADSAAYSMAVMEARAFNFYSFVNRAEASHYVSAMILQSLLSVVYFLESFLVDFVGMLQTILICGGSSTGSGVIQTVLCAALKLVPILGQIISAIQSIMTAIKQFVTAILDAIKAIAPVDRFVGRVLMRGIGYVNSLMTASAMAVFASASSHVLQSSMAVIQENDPNINSTASALLGGALSECAFKQAHDLNSLKPTGSGPVLNPFKALMPNSVQDSSRTVRAKRVMGGVANATRYAVDTTGLALWNTMVTNRQIGELLPIPANWSGVKGFINDVFKDYKKGQTRMLSYSFGRGKNVGPANYIREHNQNSNVPTSLTSQGDNIGSDDLYDMGIGPDKILGVIKNPLRCGEDEYDVSGNKPSNNKWMGCWGDPRFSQKDGNGYAKYAMKTSIWALNEYERNDKNKRYYDDGGIHWRLVRPRYPNPGAKAGPGGNEPSGYPIPGCSSPECKMGLNLKKLNICLSPVGCFAGIGEVGLDMYVANVRPVEDGNHPWMGVMPFMHFEPGQYQGVCTGAAAPNTAETYKREFNQPSTWVMLNKSPAELKNPLPDPTGAGRNTPALLNSTGKVNVALTKSGSVDLDMNVRAANRGLGFLPAGLNVFSRGQSYYHRPGNWQEQPNFFNPYWRPRLASTWQGISTFPLANQALQAMPSAFSSITQKVMTH